jgi:hypothetical protein
MSNFYKPPISNSRGRRSQNNPIPGQNNSFAKRSKAFQILEQDFPPLSSEVSFTKDKTMNYACALTIETPSIQTEKNKLSNGWVRLCFENENSGKISYEYIGNSLNDDSINVQAVRVIDNLINNWENYKIHYNELHGEDAYEKLYDNYLECYENFDSNLDSDDE